MAWVTTTLPDGAHTVTAVARDGAGNEATAAAVTVTVANDTAAPAVSVTSPAADATLNGTVTLSASATDDVAVASVQFFVDGVALGAADVDAPYEWTWSTAAVPNGAHTVTAVARDTAGKETTGRAVAVTVTNDTTPPTVAVTGPVADATVSGTVAVAATAADDFAVTGVRFLVDGVALGAEDTTAPFEASWNTTALANGSHVLTAVARDAAGHETTAAAVTVTVLNDIAAPTVAVTGPAAEATVSGTVTVAATAADDIAVTGVRFLVDGVALGAEDTTAPFEASWNTTALANGSHVLTAVARDAAGHETTAAAVTVTVLNDIAAPTVAVTAPGRRTRR